MRWGAQGLELPANGSWCFFWSICKKAQREQRGQGVDPAGDRPATGRLSEAQQCSSAHGKRGGVLRSQPDPHPEADKEPALQVALH